MINSILYNELIKLPFIRDNVERQKLLEVQQEQSSILQFLLRSYSLQIPSIDTTSIQIPNNPHELLKELIEREEELLVVYQSLPYFITTTYHQYVNRLIYLQKWQVEVLDQLRNQLQTEEIWETHAVPKNQKDFWIDEGYELELVTSGLTFPSSIVFDDVGELYAGEAGFSYGPAAAKAQIIHVKKNGETEVIASGFDRPLTGLTWHEGYFYVVTGDFNGRVYRVSKGGHKEVLVEGLRGGGDHYTSDIAFGPDGKMYFAVGTATNSGVVGRDNLMMGWLGRNEDYHDVPARDLVLKGKNYKTANFLTKKETDDKAYTGAYQPFRVPSTAGEIVEGQLYANGVIYRANPDGSNLEIIADGLRNTFGLGFSPNGKLFITSNGLDFRGSRPIEGDWDPFYEVFPGWYGWPDFGSGLPVTLPYFKPPGHSQPDFVLAQHPPIAAQPLIRFAPHTATLKFDFSTNSHFSTAGDIFFAQFGDQSPMTGLTPEPRGYRIVRVNPETGQIRDFLVNKTPGEKGNGPERPIAPRFSPDGKELYIVDFGVMEVAEGVIYPYAETGAVWKVRRKK